MAFRRSSLLIRQSFLTNTLSNCDLYSSLFQLSLASILFSISQLGLCIVRKPAVFDFFTYKCIENVLKLTKNAKQLADITCFPLENVNKYGFFEILSSQ